jgi:hypothetical protein
MRLLSLLVPTLSVVAAGAAYAVDPLKPESLPTGENMYVIERQIPGAGKMTAAEFKAAAQKSCAVLSRLGPDIQWLQSYVTADKLYCVYLAPSEDLVREHAEKSGFPANSISRVATIIGPKTAE